MPKKRPQNRSLPLAIILAGAGLLLITGALLVSRLLQPASSPPDTTAQVPRVSLQEARQAYDRGTAVFLDVRDAQSYAESHIPGAVSMPVSLVESRLAELDPQQWIIPY
jgi:hypothetical protein